MYLNYLLFGFREELELVGFLAALPHTGLYLGSESWCCMQARQCVGPQSVAGDSLRVPIVFKTRSIVPRGGKSIKRKVDTPLRPPRSSPFRV